MSNTSETAFLTEFLKEVNFFLTQEDYGNRLEDILSPIKSIIIKDKNLFSFSLSRFCGADKHIAFFSEWYYRVLKITKDTRILIEANRIHFRKKVPLHLKGVPNLYETIDKHIQTVILPRQIGILHTKNLELIQDLKQKYPFLNKYLSKEYLSRFISAELTTISKLYGKNLSNSEFLEAQGSRLSFLQIGLPCILGLSYNFHQESSPINPAKIGWILLEELLKNIASLYQINHYKDLHKFLYQQSLNEQKEFNWLRQESSQQVQIALSDPETRKAANNLEKKIFDGAMSNIKALVLPEKYQEMLSDLINWARDS